MIHIGLYKTLESYWNHEIYCKIIGIHIGILLMVCQQFQDQHGIEPWESIGIRLEWFIQCLYPLENNISVYIDIIVEDYLSHQGEHH